MLFVLVDDFQEAASALTRLTGVMTLDAAPPQPRTATRARSGSRPSTTPTSTGTRCCTGSTCDIAPGERVALIGTTGAGKTTIARIAAGLGDRRRAGTVEVGGEVGLVTQEVHVFAGTLAADLRLAKPDATDEELRAALDQAGADWGHELLDTHVGEGGHALTAAQAQQVALARLALHDPPVAILDEAGAEAGSAGARHARDRRAARARRPHRAGHRPPAHAGQHARTGSSCSSTAVIVEQGTHDAIARAPGQIRATLGGLARLDSRNGPEES